MMYNHNLHKYLFRTNQMKQLVKYVDGITEEFHVCTGLNPSDFPTLIFIDCWHLKGHIGFELRCFVF